MWHNIRGKLAELQASSKLRPKRFSKFTLKNFKEELAKLYASPELCLARSVTLRKISMGQLDELCTSSELHPVIF